MSICTDSPRSGRIGCGATYTGELAHCVATAPWSTHPDGLAHITATDGVIARLWQLGRTHPANPAEHGYTQDGRGRWRKPLTDDQRAALAALRGDAA